MESNDTNGESKIDQYDITKVTCDNLNCRDDRLILVSIKDGM
jgi:hypothetical protein